MKIYEDMNISFFKKRKLNMPFDYQKNIKNMTLLQTAEYIKKICGIDDKLEDIIDDFREIICYEYENNISLKCGIYEYLIFLKQNNIKIALVTNNDKQFYEVCLKKYQIYDIFDIIIDFTFIKHNKTFYNIYKICIEKLNLNINDIIVFENKMEAIKDAKKNNIKVFAVYDDYYLENIQNILKITDDYITDFRELIV